MLSVSVEQRTDVLLYRWIGVHTRAPNFRVCPPSLPLRSSSNSPLPMFSPGMINRANVSDTYAWVLDHPNVHNPIDPSIAASWELVEMYRGVDSLRKAEGIEVKKLLLERGRGQLETWKRKWDPRFGSWHSFIFCQTPLLTFFDLHSAEQPRIPQLRLTATCASGVSFYTKVMSFDLDFLSFLLLSTPTAPDPSSTFKPPAKHTSRVDNLAGIKYFIQTVESALDVLNGIELIEQLLRPSNDFVNICSASAAVWLAKVRSSPLSLSFLMDQPILIDACPRSLL